LADVRLSCAEILREGMNGFLERRNLLTDKQWQFLKAVAKEGSVAQPTAGSFLNKYKLGTPAAVKRIVTSLVEKELLLETLSLEGKSYCVYNVFLSRWLESN
jgi:DNA-binding MarR family transcriptional regulator